MQSRLKLLSLGQTGLKLESEAFAIYIDPYLSNSVQERDANDLARLVPVPMPPNAVTDARYILVTHAHLDHCDPETLIPISKASAECIFVCPPSVRRLLIEWEIPDSRIFPCLKTKIALSDNLTVHPVPAAHPEIVEDRDGGWEAVGFVIEWLGKRIYHAGDTSVDVALLDAIKRIGVVDIGFLPVNERNFYRDRRGIIGNMSVREAFQMAEDIGVRKLVPTHWDMFSANQVFRAEIEAVYEGMQPSFELIFYPDYI